MAKRSHNKKRNVGIIYEQLLSVAAKGLVESNPAKHRFPCGGDERHGGIDR